MGGKTKTLICLKAHRVANPVIALGSLHRPMFFTHNNDDGVFVVDVNRIPFMVVAAVLTYIGWHYLQQDARLEARRENLEHDIIMLAKKRDGKVSVSDVMELRVDERTARKLLNGLMRRGVCDINLDDVERTGLITYYFYDYSSEYKKKMEKLGKK